MRHVAAALSFAAVIGVWATSPAEARRYHYPAFDRHFIHGWGGYVHTPRYYKRKKKSRKARHAKKKAKSYELRNWLRQISRDSRSYKPPHERVAPPVAVHTPPPVLAFAKVGEFGFNVLNTVLSPPRRGPPLVGVNGEEYVQEFPLFALFRSVFNDRNNSYRRGRVAVKPWLVETVRAAALAVPKGYQVKVISTVDSRPRRTSFHPKGGAIDIQIYDAKGAKVPFIGRPDGPPGWEVYESMAIAAKQYQMKYHPKETFVWGGHFRSGVPYDRMHFQAGGTSRDSFTNAQLKEPVIALAEAYEAVALYTEETGPKQAEVKAPKPTARKRKPRRTRYAGA